MPTAWRNTSLPSIRRWPTVWVERGAAVDIRAWRDGARRTSAGRRPRRGETKAPSLSCASSTIAPAPSPNSTQVLRSFQSRMREKVSAPITSARLCEPEREELVGRRHGEDETAAHRLQIEGRALGDPEIGLDLGGGRRERCSRASRSRQRSGRCPPASGPRGQRRLRRARGQRRGRLALPAT